LAWLLTHDPRGSVVWCALFAAFPPAWPGPGFRAPAVVRSANRTRLLVSGGEQAGDGAMLDKARRSMEAGATGLIFGRNVWQREHSESLAFIAQLQEILAKYPRGGG
jgi:DhnA family fructose-bisphosphate aldolase class Ia